MSELKNQVRKICEARMEQIQITDTEKQLIQHIRGLQRTLEVSKHYVPDQVKKLIDKHIGISKEVVDLTLGIKS